ncbi:MAG TPA: AAA family ATPase [Flavisolibacter sp.]|nr:AAA family ATPase [Flavisolibacter sp.]
MFKLYYFKVIKHSYFKDLDLFFVNDDELDNDKVVTYEEYIKKDIPLSDDERVIGPYKTLIIGPNGTGKSQVLSVIIETFNILSALKSNPSLKFPSSIRFILKYFINNIEYHIDNREGVLQIFVQNQPTPIQDIELPVKVIGSAINLNDRFPIVRETNKYFTDRYEYLGVRSAPNSAYISVHIKKIIDSLSNSANKLGKLPNIRLLFEKLDLSPVINLSFSPGRRFVLKADNPNNIQNIIKSSKAFVGYFMSVITETRSKRLDERRLNKYEKLLNDPQTVDKAISFLQKVSNKFNQKYLYKIKLNYAIDFTKPETLQEFAADAEILKTLRELEIFSVNDIDIRKQKTNFSASKASSGEYHLLTSFLGIIAKIEDNSIILIDEPEISLHPNWQMQYLNVLDKVFENYNNCHFIIASHSHFLVSDLKGFNSAILTLFFDPATGLIKAKLLDNDTYGWTPENILYNIFNVASVSNHYFEMDLRNLVHLISENSDDYKRIKSYVDKFEFFERVPEDPLNIVINQAKGYLKEHGV